MVVTKAKQCTLASWVACQLYHTTDVAMVLVTITLYCQVGMALSRRDEKTTFGQNTGDVYRNRASSAALFLENYIPTHVHNDWPTTCTVYL